MLADLNFMRGNIEAVLQSERVPGDVKAMAFSYTCDKRGIRSCLPQIFKAQSDQNTQLKIATLMAIYELTYFRDLVACRSILNKLRPHDFNKVSGFEVDLFKSAYNFINLLIDDLDNSSPPVTEIGNDNNLRPVSVIGDSHIIGLSIAAPNTVNMFYLPGIRYKHISGRLPNAKLVGLDNALIASQNSSTLVFNIGEIDVRMAQINSKNDKIDLRDEFLILIECFREFCAYVKRKVLPHQKVKIIIPTFAGRHLFNYKTTDSNIFAFFISQFTEIAINSGFNTLDAYSSVGPAIGIPEDRYLDWAHFKSKYYHAALGKILGIDD
jgi:hypothetical protein